MTDRAAFFNAIRAPLFGGHLTASQVDGMIRILDYMDAKPVLDVRWRAYMLATTFHETGATIQPVREAGGEAYLRSKPYYPWVGEGLVQVTWEVNARKFGALQPGDCMTWPVALRALVDGMVGGMFTGRKLGQYFAAKVDDPVNARRIINGLDRAEMVAGYHRQFLAALGGLPVAVQPQQLHGRPSPVSAPMVRPVPVASAGDAETDRLNAASLEAARAG